MFAAFSRFFLFRSVTWRSLTTKYGYPAVVWGVTALLAHAMWQLGPRTTLGRALTGLAFPLLFVAVILTQSNRWRQAANEVLSFSVPSCTLLLFCDFLYLGTGSAPQNPEEKLCLLLDAIAGFLRENAITTALGILVLLCTFRPSWSVPDRRAFLAATIVVLLATLSVTAACAGAFCVLNEVAPSAMARPLIP